MFRCCVGPVLRRRLGYLGRTVLVGVTGLVFIACSSSGPSTQDPNAPIGVQTSQLSVVIENKAGIPLVDVDVAILPVGGATEFKKFAGRMETAGRRELPLPDFYGRDGTVFNLRVVRPKTVRVTAKDITNKPYKVEVPWR